MLRVLLVADTHLGLDLPERPRVERRRRGPDFFANLERALAPAHRGEVDLVVHGGDLLYRSRVPPGLVLRALEPLLAVADSSVPVVLVPGNHERSALPYPMLAAHPGLHVIDRPRTVRLELLGLRVAVVGFPCERTGVRDRFASLLATARSGSDDADLRLLCLHQAVEGARVGPVGYTFRDGADVVRGRDIPDGFAAVLAGHIHRHQVLIRDLAGRPLTAPVLYPGSVERTGFAERDEAKGYLVLEVAPDPTRGGRLVRWRFHDLPTRPMAVIDVDATGLDADGLTARLATRLAALDPNGVVRLRILGDLSPTAASAVCSVALRRLAPATMTVELKLAGPGFR
jgi:exonuclease SbcD